jgi:hypothetical protein
MNSLFTLRDAALNLISGGRPALLNADLPAPPPLPDLPAALSVALRDLKIAAISADGARVDYAALAASPAYAAYRAEVTARLPQFDPSRLTRGERLAFWINLYNAMVLDGVVALGVQGSVARAAPAMGFFRRIGYSVGGLLLSADDVEHGVLRANAGSLFIPGPQFSPDDPRLAWVVSPLDVRIHCALNCASRSCPPIAAYSASGIEAQLDLAARAFVDADAEVDQASSTLRLSKIFDWYRADFDGYAGVLRFVLAHLPDDARRRWLVAQPEVDLAFRAYDWSLNL